MKNWYVLYTKPKCEDSTAQLLNNAGIETLSPKIRVLKYVRRRYTDVIEHLFPSYIFALFDKDTHTHMIKYTRGVRYIVGKENPLAVHPEIIAVIQNRMDKGDIVKPVPVKLEKGDRVIIREGPFRNFYGVFDRSVSGKERVMILLEALHCKIDIEHRSVQKI